MRKPRFKAGFRPYKPKKQIKMGFNPGVPAAPAQPAWQPPVGTPDDARYQADIAGLTRGYNDANLAFQNRETSTRSDYGFDPQYANNPYTKANLLAKAAQQRYTGTTNSMARMGQLYSGATSRARTADEFTSGQQLHETRRAYEQSLAGITQERLNAQRQYETGRDTAYADLLERLAAQEPDPSLYGPEEPYYGGGGGGGGKKKKRKKK